MGMMYRFLGCNNFDHIICTSEIDSNSYILNNIATVGIYFQYCGAKTENDINNPVWCYEAAGLQQEGARPRYRL